MAVKQNSKLPNYKHALTGKGAGIAVVSTAAIITGAVIGYNVISNRKPSVPQAKPATSTTQQQTPQTTATPQPAAVNYSGAYAGTTSVSQGIANATVTVSTGNTISGTATYVGPYNAKIPLTVTGNVTSAGAVSGTFSGSSSVQGITINVSGSYTGTIANNIMSVKYKGTASGMSVSGSINLTKK